MSSVALHILSTYRETYLATLLIHFVMVRYEIIQVKGEVQMMKRDWWQLYKRGWQKHRDFWNRRWWIRFKWNAESNVP